MSQFIESICYSNGEYQNLDLHQDRVKRTFEAFFENSPFKLIEHLPVLSTSDKVKVRCLYNHEIQTIEHHSYQKREIRSLKLIHCDDIDYRFKYASREKLSSLYKKKGIADDIIILKNGLVTDASYANLVFYDGKEWLTPSDPLLHGIKRAALLKSGKIKEIKISENDIHDFQKVGLINAMLDLEEVSLPISKIS